MKTIFTLPFVFLLGLLPIIGNAQYITITGYVTDFLTGGKLENATVFEKSSGIGTISNQDGFFKLVLKPGKMNISFAESGFEAFSQKFVASSDTILNIQLKPEKWIKSHGKTDADLQSGIDHKKSSERKKFWLF